MAEFDHDRFQQVRINEVYPYAFWVWDVSNGRRGGIVCFRGDCRAGEEGKQDMRVIGWWMSEFFKATGGIDGLVVDTWEFFGHWHQELTFLPSEIMLPDTFRVLYSVMGDCNDAARLWGHDRIRDNLDVALAEMDEYLSSLPARSTDPELP